MTNPKPDESQIDSWPLKAIFNFELFQQHTSKRALNSHACRAHQIIVVGFYKKNVPHKKHLSFFAKMPGTFILYIRN